MKLCLSFNYTNKSTKFGTQLTYIHIGVTAILNVSLFQCVSHIVYELNQIHWLSVDGKEDRDHGGVMAHMATIVAKHNKVTS